ncbi:ABC transporter ATP-binding protein [Crocinitomix catalasitica]|uniref:ABC transporter ATP-binding protein n=1 Tax=Crocinitomix catalasitica TaxID=184607 RepID=UPI0012FAFA98|nr:ABC transporter ATP-binding protein [Crocinitomix catalasitica]
MAIRLKSTYFSTYKNVFKLLPKNFKKKLYGVQFLIIITSFVDLIGLALFVPILSAIADNEVLYGDGILADLKTWSGVEDNNMFILYLFIAAFVFFILRSLFILLSNWIQNKFAFDLSEYIGSKTYNYYLNLDYKEFDKIESNQVIRELNSNPKNFSQFLVKSLLLINSELIAIILIISGIALYDFKVLLLIVFTIFPFAVLFNYAVKKRMKRYGEEQNALSPILYSQSIRGVFGYIDVKLRQKEENIIKDYDKTMSALNSIALKLSVYAIIPAKLFELVTVGGLLLIFSYGAFLADNSAIVLPLIAVYAAAGYRIIPSLSKLIPSFLQLQQYSYLFRTYEKPLNHELSKSKSVSSEPLNFNSKIQMSNIDFKFKTSEPLFFDSINLELNKNEIIGIIGKSGSGKTTLIKMLAGFIKPTQGEILIDGKPLNESNMVAWMQKISYVQQSPYIENGSLASNIAFLEDSIDENRLSQAIELASLSELIKDKSAQDFLIKENGKNLSGGQKQRVIIARALYHQSEVLILDEATSALDNQTENEINQTVSKLSDKNITIIIIAHRYSTLKHTTRIVELDQGKVIGEKQYADLI